MKTRRSRQIATLLLLVVLAALTKRAAAQAWTPSRGEGYVSVAFGDFFVRDHLQSNGDRIDVGHIRTLILAQSIEYGITDRLSADLTFPVVASKYYGPDPHQLPIDNGNYHGGTQDLAVGVRYAIRRRPFALTPFVTLTLPSRGYTYYAHSAVGTNLRALALGLAAGRESESWLPNAYFQAMYSYSIVEPVTGIRPGRNNMSLEGGYFLGRHFTLRAVADALITHGGLNIPQDFPLIGDSSDPTWHHHDQSINARHLNLGGEVSVALGRNWDVFAGVTHTLWGENEHATRLGVSMGVSRRFTTPWARRRNTLHATSTPPSKIDRF
jgi:hypothetical protein